MASEERRAANSKIKEQNLFASLGAAEQQAETDAFQCGRCKQVCLSFVLTIFLLTYSRGNVDIGKLRPEVPMSL
jgi:hypothetical protein